MSTLPTRPLVAMLPLLLLLFAPRARAAVDGIEIAFGASNIAAVAGNGGLTAAVSPDGDLSVLSWPSPSFYDQVHALQQNGPGARDLPRMGLKDGMGIYAALVIEDAEGAREVRALHELERAVRYAGDDTSIVETTFSWPERGLTVVQSDVVAVDADVLVRRYAVRRAADSDVAAAWLAGYENLSPSLSMIAKVPMVDVLLDHKNDFVAAWDVARDQLIHFHPESTGVVTSLLGALRDVERDFGPLGELLAAEAVDADALDALLTDLDASYAPGVYAAVGSVPAADGWQVGGDRTDTCAAIDEWIDTAQRLPEILPDQHLPADPGLFDEARCGDFAPLDDVVAAEGWQVVPRDAREDLADDGALEGARLAAGQVNAALRVPLSFALANDDSGDDVAMAELYFAFASTHAEASAVLDAAREQGGAAVERARAERDRAFTSDLALPRGGSDDLRAFSQRALLNLRAGTDRTTRAIVASISRQPPYQLDWPRDGAFFNVALDLSGQHDLVTERLRFYADTMRDEASDPVPVIDAPGPGWPSCFECTAYPPDSWEMNYYADGTPGGNIRLEIDNSALLIWSFVTHAGFLAGKERDDYLDEMWPVVERGARFLAGWRDDMNGLVWYANEDDHAEYTQGLQGAVTVFGALRVSAALATLRGRDDLAVTWAARASELRRALLEHLYGDERGFLYRLARADEEQAPADGGGASSWLAWPARVLPADDPRVVAQLERNLERVMPKVRGAGPGGGYPTKVGLSAALLLPDGPARDEASEMVEQLVGELAGPTRQLGEVFVNVDDDGDGLAERQVNATAPPHLWAAALVYLTAMAYHQPEAFDPLEDWLPPVWIPGDPPPDAAACACASSGDDASAAASIVLLFFVAFAVYVRRERWR